MESLISNVNLFLPFYDAKVYIIIETANKKKEKIDI